MGEIADRLRSLGLKHFEVDEEHKVITVTDFEEFTGLRDLLDPGAEITLWADKRGEFSGQSFRYAGYGKLILAKDIPE